MSAPAVSVILPVYNGAADVPAAIDSILAQSFRDFELIAIDDGSAKDDTLAVLQRIAAERNDSRLRVEALQPNRGLAAALNHGVGLARGRYIARQDHDDISGVDRLAKQVRFLDENPDCGLLGTRAEIWRDGVHTGRNHDHPMRSGEIRIDLLSNNPFVHASVMLRREVFDVVGLYTTDRARQPPEDYELWSRVARRFAVANLPERLMIYREVPTSMSRDGDNPFLAKVILIASENIAFWAGLDAPDQPCRDGAALANAAYAQVSPGADIAAIVDRLMRATQAIAGRHPDTDLAGRIEALLANVRHHHLAAARGAKTLPTWSAPVAAAARRMPIPVSLKARVKDWLLR